MLAWPPVSVDAAHLLRPVSVVVASLVQAQFTRQSKEALPRPVRTLQDDDGREQRLPVCVLASADAIEHSRDAVAIRRGIHVESGQRRDIGVVGGAASLGDPTEFLVDGLYGSVQRSPPALGRLLTRALQGHVSLRAEAMLRSLSREPFSRAGTLPNLRPARLRSTCPGRFQVSEEGAAAGRDRSVWRG